MSHPVTTFPFDCDTALADPDWREHVAWPRSLQKTDAGNRAAWTRFWNLIRSLDGLARDALQLVGGRLFHQGLALAEAASVAQAARARNFVMRGGQPAVRYLAGDEAVQMPPGIVSPFKSQDEPSFIAARRLARSLAISPVRAWPRAMLAPEAVALSHNPLMHSYAVDRGIAVTFRHSEDYFRAMRRRGVSASPAAFAADVALQMCELFSAGRNLDSSCRKSYVAMIAPFFERHLIEAARDIEGIRSEMALPDRIWIGSSGYYPSRMVAQEVTRRGGSVTSFEHGWGAGCESVAQILAFGDLSFVNQYVAYTTASAAKLAAHRANEIALLGKTTQYVGGRGDPSMKELRLTRAASPAGKPRVLYAPTITLGLRQMTPPLPADPIYLQWQFAICEALDALPVDFVCRPHPEGFFRNQPHPLDALPFTSDQPFEQLIAETDVFVFDWQQTTTFGHALCSDRPIVFLDFGTRSFDAETEAAIRRRCRVIEVAFDEFNRAIVPLAALRDAVLASNREPPDTSYFRALTIGV